MENLLDKAFVKTLAESQLHIDGNRYAKNFVNASVTITTKRGKTLCYYSQTQKNITGLYNQCKRVIDANYTVGKHSLKITVE